MTDRDYMRSVLRLASRGRGNTSPNPMVGAIIVKRNRVIGKGYHKRVGSPHAETLALKEAGEKATDATIYVNLEPCCHRDKKTPPCTDAVIRAGVKKVVIGMVDPNPKVSGGGINILRKAGIKVITGILEEESRRLNEAYIKYITTGIPFVILKIASSLDGKIATGSGESKWITGEQSRKIVHRLRSEVDAVMVGIGTVLMDDPMLNVRLIKGRNPHRLILDSQLKISLTARILNPELNLSLGLSHPVPSESKTYIVTSSDAPEDKIIALEKKGIRIIPADSKEGYIDLPLLMKELGNIGIMSLMIEGGSETNASALRAGIIDKVLIFLSPKIIGGSNSKGSVGGTSPERLTDAIILKDLRFRRSGEDLLIEGYLR
jgi:diaminohydroxyphosphoribosylaminopyrimidine deaminase/5-amino-6-(5-phosphoribosylamino)uracil reductase